MGLDVTITPGDAGELTVWVDGRKVSEKRGTQFPEPAEVVAAVRAALPPT